MQDQSDHIYYDISMINNKDIETSLFYRETRNNPLLMKPSDYYFSIVRFHLQTPSLPVFIPKVKLSQSNPNLLAYKLYMVNTSSGASYSENVIYTPSNSTLIVPAAPLTSMDLSTEYYFMYNINDWIQMLNLTLKNLCTSAGSEIAFFYYNIESELISLYVPASFNNTFKIYCNSELEVLLDSLPFKYTNTVAFGPLYEFQFYNNLKNLETVNSVNYWVMKQELSTLSLYNPVSSIVFTSGTIPLYQENVSAPKVYGSIDSQFSNGNNANIAPIMTDFEVAISSTNNYKQEIVYVPSGEYRLINLIGDKPINEIVMNVYWKDSYGNLHNFNLKPNCKCDIKIMFRKKTFNGNL